MGWRICNFISRSMRISITSSRRAESFARIFEAGLVTDVSRFHAYREARNITSHSYDREKAQRIVAELPRFANDVAHLLAQLEARNRGGD